MRDDTELVDTLTPNSEEQQPEQVVDTEAKVAPTQETNKEINFRNLREKTARVERERDEAVRRLQEMESRYTQPVSPQPDDEEIRIGPDELAEGKHIAQMGKQIKKLETELKDYRKQVNADTVNLRLKAQYPDFDAIVTKENVEALRDMYPEVAQAIHSSPDLYSQAASAYTIIKKMGIYQESSTLDNERASVQKNAYKPKPTASISPQQGETPLSKANAFAHGLTPELKAQLLKEMALARREL